MEIPCEDSKCHLNTEHSDEVVQLVMLRAHGKLSTVEFGRVINKDQHSKLKPTVQ